MAFHSEAINAWCEAGMAMARATFWFSMSLANAMENVCAEAQALMKARHGCALGRDGEKVYESKVIKSPQRRANVVKKLRFARSDEGILWPDILAKWPDQSKARNMPVISP